MPAWKWVVLKFANRAHFMRLIAAVIVSVAAYQSIRFQKIEDTWLILVGAVMNHYFNHKEAGVEPAHEDIDPDDQKKK